MDEPNGDPGNTLSRAELEDKALRLALYKGGASEAEMRGVIERVGGLRRARRWGCLWSRRELDPPMAGANWSQFVTSSGRAPRIRAG